MQADQELLSSDRKKKKDQNDKRNQIKQEKYRDLRGT